MLKLLLIYCALCCWRWKAAVASSLPTAARLNALVHFGPAVRTAFHLPLTLRDPRGGNVWQEEEEERARYREKIGSACFVTMDHFTSCWIVGSWVILEVPIKLVCNLPASHSLIVPLTEQVPFVKRGDSLRSLRSNQQKAQDTRKNVSLLVPCNQLFFSLVCKGKMGKGNIYNACLKPDLNYL